MGSFTSAPKIMNEDCEDDDLDFLNEVSCKENLLHYCQCRLSGHPPLILRRTQVLSSPPTHPSRTVRVLQWNILSQTLGQNKDNFCLCPSEALSWNTRRFRVLEEIITYQPEIICLQEVDHFLFLKQTLGSLGFSGLFFPKPDSPCLYVKGNNGPDGCAIFYDKNKYELLDTETRVVEVWKVQSNQVIMLAIFRDLLSGRRVCVATTHLKAREGALLSTIRNEQGKDILNFLSQHAQGLPLIICGDFNAEPSEPVYTTMLNGPVTLASAYTSLRDDRQEPPYTTWKVRGEGEVKHTIDYIFYTPSTLTPVAVLDMPAEEDVGAIRVPSFSYPSDHFSLVCDFAWTD